MNFVISRRHLMPILALTICLIIVLPTVLLPATSKAQSVGPPGALSRRDRLGRLAAVSPAMARHIEELRLMDRAFAQEPNEPEDTLPEDVQDAPVIWAWRYVHVYCPVSGSFAPLKEDWLNWAGQDYKGDCHFYIDYGAEYYGDFGGYLAMPGDKKITDQWKKGMKFNTAPDDLKAPYYWLSGQNYDCSDTNTDRGYCGGKDASEFTASCTLDPKGAGGYDQNTGRFTTTIGATGEGHWVCGYSMEILTSSGSDLTVFSPKPSVSSTVTDLTTGKNVKPEQMVTDYPYELRINMKGFGIKTPALATQSSWDYVDWWFEGTAWHAQPDSGMWVTRTDPSWYINRWSGPFLATGDQPDWCPWTSHEGAGGTYGCWGGAEWYHHNTWANYWQDTDGNWYPSYELFWPPSTTKALFPPSSVGLKFLKSDISIAPNFDGTETEPGTQGYLYQFGMWTGYSNKGISFITSNDISFSGNPTTVRAVTQGQHQVYFDLELYGTYPNRVYA
jgi:hypothetical protein